MSETIVIKTIGVAGGQTLLQKAILPISFELQLFIAVLTISVYSVQRTTVGSRDSDVKAEVGQQDNKTHW